MSGRRSMTRVAVAATGAAVLVLGTGLPAQAAPHWERGAMRVPQANRISTGKGVTVAVLDTGVDARHPAVRGKVTTGPDYIRSGAEPGDADWGDHGTAMASDVLSVAPDARILSVRVIMDDGDPVIKKKKHKENATAVPNGIRYATDHGAGVISMSLGDREWSLNGYDDDVAAAIRYANDHGVTVVASAGNGGDTHEVEATNKNSYPAGYAGVLAVGALDSHYSRARFSQVHSYMQVSAPGVGIYSAKHYGGYAPVDGTSPAGALTAGVVALVRAKYPKLSSYQVRSSLTTSAFRAESGHWNPLLGWGMVNAPGALKMAAKMRPWPAKVAPEAYHGPRHFGQGPDDTADAVHPPMDTIGLAGSIVAVVVGLALIGGAVLMTVLRRRRGARGTAAG